MNRSGKREYTDEHARAGVSAKLPALETWPNQFPSYEIRLAFPEFTSVCPKTGLPDFGSIEIVYLPDKRCVETKSLKLYLTAFRNLGIFQENAVNRILSDFVKACRPKRALVRGVFQPRGGIRSVIVARHPRSARAPLRIDFQASGGAAAG